MSTLRVARRHRYTTVDRETVNDDALSFRARGVLLWLLDKPDDWRCNADVIEKAGTEGRDAVRTALKELEVAGYLRRERVQAEKGRWVTVTTVYEVRNHPTDDGIPGVGHPTVGEPDVGAPGAIPKTETENCERRETSSLAIRPRNELWDALVQGIGVNPTTKSACSLMGKTVKELKELAATPEDVLLRCAEYRRRWPNVELTAPALITHWDRMGQPRVEPPPKMSKGAQSMINVLKREGKLQ